MPPLPAIKTDALSRLAEELKFVPQPAARRHLLAAESLLTSVDAGQTYPEDWIVQRITGFRPDIADPMMVSGAELLHDLGALVDRLCGRANFKTSELHGWIAQMALCERFGVTRKTLERYRREGLISRRAKREDGRTVVLYRPEIVEAFAASQKGRLEKAGAFTRMSDEEQQRMIKRARRYRRALGCSRFAVAQRLAKRFGRTPEAVRLLLLRNDKGARAPIFREKGRLLVREHRVIERALRKGVAVGLVGKRFKKSPATAYRVAAEHTVRMLRDAEPATGGAGSYDDLTDALLASVAVREGLGRAGPPNLAEMYSATMLAGAPDAAVERARARAFRGILARAAAGLAALPNRSPRRSDLDRVITDLRWAARLKAELVRSEHMLLLKTIQTQLGREILELPSALAAELYGLCVDSLIGAVERFDPAKGGRLSAPAGLALSRAVSRFAAEHGALLKGSGRAMAIGNPAKVRLEDWTRKVADHQAFTEPDPRISGALVLLDASDAAFLRSRFGYDISPPTALADLAAVRSDAGVREARVREHKLMQLAIERARGTDIAPGGHTR